MTLRFMDEHSTVVHAPRPVVWEATRSYAYGLAGADHGFIGLLLGTEPASGFAVDEDVPGERIALAGRHRFARYRLVFSVADAGDATRLTAASYSDFRGLHGRLYQAVLVGSRGHVLAVQAMLRTIRRSAE